MVGTNTRKSKFELDVFRRRSACTEQHQLWHFAVDRKFVGTFQVGVVARKYLQILDSNCRSSVFLQKEESGSLTLSAEQLKSEALAMVKDW